MAMGNPNKPKWCVNMHVEINTVLKAIIVLLRLKRGLSVFLRYCE